MSTLVPVSRERHARLRWRPCSSYSFVARNTLVPLVAAELSSAATVMPLALVRQGEGFSLSALLGVESSTNVFVSLEGRWLGRYIPSALRAYPFSLARTESGGSVLCVDEASGLVSEDPVGEPFFNDSGEPSEALGRVLNFLQQVEFSRVQTSGACAALVRHGLVRNWPILLKEGGEERRIEGLFQVDEPALNQLPDEAFLDLRRAGALPLAYCQMLSTQNLPLLGELAKARVPASPPPAESLGFSLPEDGLLQFDWGRFGQT